MCVMLLDDSQKEAREKALDESAEIALELIGFAPEDAISFSIDKNIVEEAFLRAKKTLGDAFDGKPNEIKQIAHCIFWLRKLKPFQLKVFDANAAKGKSGRVFFNELAALIYGLTTLEDNGCEVDIFSIALHDLSTNMRYNSFSPGSISAIIELMSPRLSVHNESS